MKYDVIGKMLSVIILLAFLSACSTAGKNEQQNVSLKVLTIGTADNGGTMYPVGSAIAKIITEANNSIKININASSGSMMNVNALNSGEIDMGLVSGDVAYAAMHGLDGFDQPVAGLRAIAAVYSSSSNWMVPYESDAVFVHDLTGKRIGVGPRDSATELAARNAIDILGLDQSGIVFDNSSLSGGKQKIVNGQLDAVHAFTGIPVIAFADFAQTVPSRVLGFTEAEIKEILSQNEFYYQTTIPAGTYKDQANDVTTFGVKCLLCVDESMEKELVYALVESLWEMRNSLEAYHSSMDVMQENGFMYEDIPIPLHDGAIQFYKNAGMLK